MSGRLGMLGGVLVVSGALLVGAGTLVGGTRGADIMGTGFSPSGMMGGNGGGMMGGNGASQVGPGPGETGFVGGTVASPRVVRVLAGPGYSFSPTSITVAAGETVTFEVISMGGLVHEFMVGPADAVAADTEGTPEVADIGMMQTKSVTVTFDGSGPYAFACHAAGHYEAGMRGTITVVG
ncbi:MAG: plastocyanin/azurin family copper-binding protein [Candidatus Limnocylindrales bacterium]